MRITRATERSKAVRENMQQGLPIEAAENQEQAARLLQAIRTYGFDCSLQVFAHIIVQRVQIVCDVRLVS